MSLGLQIRFINLPSLQEFHGMIRLIIGILTQRVYFPLLRILPIILSRIGLHAIKIYKELETSGTKPSARLRKIRSLQRKLHLPRKQIRQAPMSLLPLWTHPKHEL
nr:MAG: putative transmembrane protein [Polycipiviridae sp.]